MHTYPHTLTYTHTLAPASSHIHMYIHTHSHAHAHTHTLTYSLVGTHTHTHIHTHTHTYGGRDDIAAVVAHGAAAIVVAAPRGNNVLLSGHRTYIHTHTHTCISIGSHSPSASPPVLPFFPRVFKISPRPITSTPASSASPVIADYIYTCSSCGKEYKTHERLEVRCASCSHEDGKKRTN